MTRTENAPSPSSTTSSTEAASSAEVSLPPPGEGVGSPEVSLPPPTVSIPNAFSGGSRPSRRRRSRARSRRTTTTASATSRISARRSRALSRRRRRGARASDREAVPRRGGWVSYAFSAFLAFLAFLAPRRRMFRYWVKPSQVERPTHSILASWKGSGSRQWCTRCGFGPPTTTEMRPSAVQLTRYLVNVSAASFGSHSPLTRCATTPSRSMHRQLLRWEPMMTR